MWWLASIVHAATVTGTVTDAVGEPVDNAFVIVYDSRFQFEFDQTGPDGVFAVDALPADRYRVRVLPPSENDSAEVWAGGTLGACNAQPFEVGEDEVEVVDVALSRGARLSGRILIDGEPAQGVRVTAKTQRSGLIAQNRFDFTDPTGTYVIRGITPDQEGMGVFALEAQILGRPTQFVPGAYNAADAVTFELVAAQEVEVDDFDLLSGVSFSGQVNGPDGAVNGGDLIAFSSGQSVVSPIAGGTYDAVGLRPGEVLVWASADGLATTYLGDAARPADRIDLPNEGDRLTGIDIAMPAESTLSAQLAGGPFEATSVLLFNETQTAAVSAEVDVSGRFEVGTLHPGSYIVFVDGVADGLVEDFVRDADGEPQVFTVDGPTDVGIVQVPAGSSLSGRVTDRHSGEPVYGAAVIAEALLSGERRTVSTARDGTYSLDGLFADRWQLRAEYQPACLPDPSFVPIYYPDQRNPTLGGIIEVFAGEVLTWDPLIAPDVDRDGMDDVWEQDNGLDPSRNDGAEDLDGDGFTNRDEYLLGTDPNDMTTVQPPAQGCSCGVGGRLSWMVTLFALLWVRRTR